MHDLIFGGMVIDPSCIEVGIVEIQYNAITPIW